ncbi:MAG: hypothetical protein U5K69_29670 [Balneolaceae bacterium]|nr:hypothetical protein [Balneolaceae bacterium]
MLIYPAAFTEQGLALINEFGEVITANEHEAKKLFACNATCPDGKNVIIQKAVPTLIKNCATPAQVHEVDTSEYLKSGGSVFCMKQLLW